MEYIAMAIPAFFVLMGLELGYAHWRKLALYRLGDAVNDLSLGILSQLGGLLMAGLLVFGYVAIYEHARLFDLPGHGVWPLVVCWILVDFCYYWFHRASHEVNFLWAAHLVHHQSEEYNLAVALRQSLFQQVFSTVFYFPLALLGFPPKLFGTAVAFNTLYQFWIHTRAIGKLGLIEKIFMTPSHHRVHHGRNPKYIDKNHGGTFIIWDKLFGTFYEEEEEPTYGITKPLESWNPLWANVHYWVELWQAASRATRLGDKLAIFLKPPGWFPAELGGFQPPPPLRGDERNFYVPLARNLNLYGLLQFAALNLGVALYLQQAPQLGSLSIVGGALMITYSLFCLGFLFEARALFWRLEALRLVTWPLAPFVVPELRVLPVWLGLAVYAALSLGVLKLLHGANRARLAPA